MLSSNWRLHQEYFHVRSISDKSKGPLRFPQASNYKDFFALFQYKLLQF